MKNSLPPNCDLGGISGGPIIGMIPPHPVTPFPWAALVLGGVLYGIAMIWIGSLLWRGKAVAP